LIGGGATDLGSGRWRVDAADDPEGVADRCVRALVAADAPVFEIAPLQRDLETVFREANEGVAHAR
jgi:hypothetical protein